MVHAQQVDSVSLRVVTFNIAGGRFGDMEAIAAVITALQPDVVALQEVASNWEEASRSTDQADDLGRRLGMEAFYAPIYSTGDGQGGLRRFGLAVLTRHPVVRRVNHDLTRLSTQTESTVPGLMPGFPELITRVGGIDVRVFNTHLDYRRDPAVRQQQVRDMLEIIGAFGGPTLLLGDLNARPEAPEIKPLLARFRDAWSKADGPGFTSPAREPANRIDYVLVSPHCRVRHARVLATGASDHYPVVTDLRCAP